MDAATYLVSEDIARRSGLIDSRYRIQDGRYVLNDRDLARIRFTADEYISGLPGVEKTTSEEAHTLIAGNNFHLGPATDHPEEETDIVQDLPAEEGAITEEDNTQEQE